MEGLEKSLASEDSISSFIETGAIKDQPPIKIWHISDPHFVAPDSVLDIAGSLSWVPGLAPHDEDIWAAVRNLAHSEVGPDILVVSGDLSSMGTRASLEYAKGQILSLAEHIGLAEDRVIVVPGNHDRFFGYLLPLRWVRGAFSSLFEKHCEPRILEIRQFKVLIYPFDSTESGFRLWPFFASTGKVSRRQFNDFNKFIGSVGRSSIDALVAILHHHPLPVPEIDLEGLTVMKNGGIFMAHMHEQTADLVLHGHMHHSYSCRISYREHTTDTVVSAAGSACQRGDQRCHLSVLELHPGRKVVVKVFRYLDTGFSLDANRGRVFRLTV